MRLHATAARGKRKKVGSMTASRVLGAACAIGLVSCGGGGGQFDAALRQEFRGVEVARIGEFHPAFPDYEDVAVLNSLRGVRAAGVPEERIIRAEVAPARAPENRTHIGAALPSNYEVWIVVEGCRSPIYFKTDFSGRPIAQRDSSGCMPGTVVFERPAQ